MVKVQFQYFGDMFLSESRLIYGDLNKWFGSETSRYFWKPKNNWWRASRLRDFIRTRMSGSMGYPDGYVGSYDYSVLMLSKFTKLHHYMLCFIKCIMILLLKSLQLLFFVFIIMLFVRLHECLFNFLHEILKNFLMILIHLTFGFYFVKILKSMNICEWIQ